MWYIWAPIVRTQGERLSTWLRQLLSGLGARYEGPDLPILGLALDESEVRPGCLFVAREGYYGDSHDRIDAAIAAGASAVVVQDPARAPAAVPTVVAPRSSAFLGLLSDRFYASPTAALRVYGVTGTNGKTSVAFLLEHLLRAAGERPALLSTVAYRYGDRALPAVNTTPDALYVHRFARAAAAAGATALVLEVSSHALDLGRVAGVSFDVVGFTNLSHEHLDHHGTMEAYRATKRRLFNEVLIASVAAGKAPAAVACLDDGEGRGMLAAAPRAVRRLGVGSERLGGGVGLSVAPITGGGSGEGSARVEVLRADAPAATIRLPMVGAYNRANAALALGMVAQGCPGGLNAALAGLEDFPGVPGRLEAVAQRSWAGRAVLVDYAHTPDALQRALTAVTDAGEGAPTVVIGCGGDRDPSKRGPMAQVAVAAGGRVLLTSDNPRSESPDSILAQMRAGLDVPDRVEVYPERAYAIAAALGDGGAPPVLIAGKGHEPYQEISGVRYHLDDREEARRCLLAHRAGVDPSLAPLLCGWSLTRLAQALAGRVETRGPAWPLGTLHVACLGPDQTPGSTVIELLPDGLHVGVGEVATRPGAWVGVAHAPQALYALLLAVLREAGRREGGLAVAGASSPSRAEGGPVHPTTALVALEPLEWLRLAPAHRVVLLPPRMASGLSAALRCADAGPRPIPVPAGLEL